MTHVSPPLAPRDERAFPPAHACELSIVVPVFRMGNAARRLIERLRAALPDGDWEVLFVDDNSPDDTVATIEAMTASDPHVKVLRRVGRSGMTQTCLVAMLASGARYVAMLDLASGCERLLAMLDHVRSDADLVVAARPGAVGGRF